MNQKYNYVKRYGRFVKDYATFVKELPDSFSEIGAMLPSSPHLAKLMIKPLDNYSSKRRILEVGPGTGPFTRAIIKKMNKEDEFIICEINSRFMTSLKNSLSTNPDYLKNKDRIFFYQGSVLELPNNYKTNGFDMIVSSIPFHNFSPEIVDNFFCFFREILKNEGTLSFFHYAGLRKISGMSLNKDIRDRVKGVDQVIDKWCDKISKEGTLDKKISLLNLPPAVSVHLSMNENVN